MFLANYSDGLIDLRLPDLIENFDQAEKDGKFHQRPPEP